MTKWSEIYESFTSLDGRRSRNKVNEIRNDDTSGPNLVVSFSSILSTMYLLTSGAGVGLVIFLCEIVKK